MKFIKGRFGKMIIQLEKFLTENQKISNLLYCTEMKDGYWSNLTKNENAWLMELINEDSVEDSIKKTNPDLYDVIFSPKRQAGIELLQLKGNEIVVDLGCMWGALTIPLAKQAKLVLGIDQTMESLRFTEARVKQEQLLNLKLLCGNLRALKLPQNCFDAAVVNGVLEWIPEFGKVEVKNYLHDSFSSDNVGIPRVIQKRFLMDIRSSLSESGRLYLAIENRYDYKMFFGIRDPHSGLLLTSIAPRLIANLISKIFRKRSYRTWIYSFNELRTLLTEAGYSNVKLFSCWPDYRFPEYISPYGEINPYFKPMSARMGNQIGLKRLVANRLEWALFKVLNLQTFAPSIICIAEK